jgi:hypothetical protein
MQRKGWFVAGVGVVALTLRSVPGVARGERALHRERPGAAAGSWPLGYRLRPKEVQAIRRQPPRTGRWVSIAQIDKGRIDQVEAVINTVPCGMRSAVWDPR